MKVWQIKTTQQLQSTVCEGWPARDTSVELQNRSRQQTPLKLNEMPCNKFWNTGLSLIMVVIVNWNVNPRHINNLLKRNENSLQYCNFDKCGEIGLGYSLVISCIKCHIYMVRLTIQSQTWLNIWLNRSPWGIFFYLKKPMFFHLHINVRLTPTAKKTRCKRRHILFWKSFVLCLIVIVLHFCFTWSYVLRFFQYHYFQDECFNGCKSAWVCQALLWLARV